MLGKLLPESLPIIRRYGLTKVNFADTLKRNVQHECKKSSISLDIKMNSTLPADEELQEIFKLKNTKISNWIIEVAIINFMIVKCNVSSIKKFYIKYS